MKIIKNITEWLEARASTPDYRGWVLIGIALCFLASAINTMIGWLYVISGVMLAFLGISAVIAPRSLGQLVVKRQPIHPVTTGDEIKIEIDIHNKKQRPVILLRAIDNLPFILGKPVTHQVEIIPPQGSHRWTYYYPTQRRGIYRWHTVKLTHGGFAGLFESSRQRECPARAVVYPTVLPLNTCPLVDEIGQDESQRGDPRGKPLQLAASGLVRSLRPYRIGDSIRLIHWRTSARYGELRVRELETITGGQDVIIALDSAAQWQEDNFEQAVIAAASLYFYAQRQKIQVQLWTAATGPITGDSVVLDTLAATNPLEEYSPLPDDKPVIWLTQNPTSFSSLPLGSRWLLWENLASPNSEVVINRDYPGIILQPQEELQLQLQKPLNKL
jgi:uncharacterized protein (DUF58 family)